MRKRHGFGAAVNLKKSVCRRITAAPTRQIQAM